MRLSTKLGAVVSVGALIVVAAPLLRQWSTQDEEGRVPVSATLYYTPAEQAASVTYRLGYDIQRQVIERGPFGASGAARPGDTIFMIAVPHGETRTAYVELRVRGALVKSCARPEIETGCVWIVA